MATEIRCQGAALHALLDHPVRMRIIAWIAAHPGGHLSRLVRALHLGWGNAHHHVDRMLAAGLVLQEHEGNRVHLFLPGQVPHDERRLFAVLEHDRLRSVVGVVKDVPGINQSALAKRLGITATATRKHVRRLIQEGILEATRDGKQVRYDLASPQPHHILEGETRTVLPCPMPSGVAEVLPRPPCTPSGATGDTGPEPPRT